MLLDDKRKIVSYNRAFFELFGYTGDEIIGMSVRAIHPSDESFFKFGSCAYPVIQSESAYRTEWTFARRDGTMFPVETVTSVIRNQGNITGYVAIIRDITKRKWAEKALRESEERYRIAIEHSNDGVAVLGGPVHVYVNSKLVEIFGYKSYREIIGKPVTFLVHPDDRDRVASIIETRQNDGPAPARYEFRGIKKDGTSVYVEVSVTTIAYHGERATLSYVRDVTERKLGRSRPEGKVKIPPTHTKCHRGYLHCSGRGREVPQPQTEEKSGYSPEELKNIPFMRHVHPKTSILCREHYWKRLRGEELVQHLSLRMSKSGDLIWGEINSVDIEWEGRPTSPLMGVYRTKET